MKGVHVGHVTHIEDNVPVPNTEEKSSVRTGITAIVPYPDKLFNEHLAAGGFVLNGIGEMSGLTQAIEWGWMETPLLLTNTMSVGHVHTGIVDYMMSKNPNLGTKIDVTIPLVGETNDAFLNDVRIFSNTADQAIAAIKNAKSGPVVQGSVGAGTGMISFDFAGGIGSSSRIIQKGKSLYTVGVLVESNFGKMHNLTIDGNVIGRYLDPLYPYKKRRRYNYGSVIVIVATDAPLLSSQLNRLAKRAALGLGRVGTYSATTSGEIAFAFSTANPISRSQKQKSKEISLNSVNDTILNLLYEATIEATEEAVLNALFCSAGMKGRAEHYVPPIPVEVVKRHLRSRKIIDILPG